MQLKDKNLRLLTEGIKTALNLIPAGPVGVAVSGGGDSMVLLSLMQKMAAAFGHDLHVATVNHNLRKEAAAEAQLVASYCRELDVPHSILHWRDWDGQGNLQARARQARRSLISDWAKPRGIAWVATGHTLEDQAETFLMRLARGSGVDGLAAIHPVEQIMAVNWVRPLLELRRSDLRLYLQEQEIDWAEDPSNSDPQFDRVKMRQALEDFARVGITPEVLGKTASRMQITRMGLEQATKDLAKRAANPTAQGGVVLDVQALQEGQLELQLRLLAHCLRWIATSKYRPRFEALQLALEAIIEGRAHSLAGCLISKTKAGKCEICREAAAMPVCALPLDLYDQRWRIMGPINQKDFSAAPLTVKGLAQLPDWRGLGRSRNCCLSLPAIWHNDELITTPLADMAPDWKITLAKPENAFFTTLVTH